MFNGDPKADIGKRIKNYWLLSTMFLMVYDSYLTFPKWDLELGFAFFTILVPFGNLLLKLTDFLLLYFLSYKRNRSGYLTFSVTLGFFWTAVHAWMILRLALYINEPFSLYLHGGILFALKIIWLVSSLRLRKWNRTIEMEKLALLPECRAYSDRLEGIDDLSELRLAYTEEVRLHPQMAYWFKKIHDRRKTKIEQTNNTLQTER